MLGAALITIIPTLLFYIALPKAGFKIKSNYLRLSLSWFAGMYIFTITTFLLAMLLNLFAKSVLFKASLEVLAVFLVILFFYFKKDLVHLKRHFMSQIKSRVVFKPLDLITIFSCLLFSFLFFNPHLTYERGALYTSPVFWDFQWLMSLTQSFAYGDNFPPQNEAFAGLSANYHYFWMVITAIYEVMGLNLVQAMNFFSILGFFFLLLAIIGVSQEIFYSKLAGIIAVILTITSSSGRFIDYLSYHQNLNFTEMISSILTNTKHPFFSAIYPVKDFIYNGTMYNLFYFLEERQMILGVIYLLICGWIIYNRKHFSSKILLMIGALMGAYFLWHLYITLMVLGALIFILIFDKDRKQTLLLLAGFSAVFGLHYLYFKELTHSEWFRSSIGNFPKFNLEFSDQRGKPFSLKHAIDWYAFSYGLKIILFPVGLFWLWLKNRKAALMVSAVVIPTFLAINSIQLSPADIYENHKWLRPMNIFVDLAVVSFIVSMFFPPKLEPSKRLQRALSTLPAWVITIFLLTASGIIELMPFINSKPTQFFAFYPSSITSTIAEKTPPRSTFVAADDIDIFLAGRKLFMANKFRGHDIALDRKRRLSIIKSIYAANDLKTFCSLTKKYDIDYVEFKNLKNFKSKDFIEKLPHVSSTNLAYEIVYFVDVKSSCK